MSLLPQPSTILDAACGAGLYMSMLLEKGYTVVGINPSQGMLSRAKAKIPTVQMEKVGLQEMVYAEIFYGAICMDAMEHLFPEDWALILSHFQRALKSHIIVLLVKQLFYWDEVWSCKGCKGDKKPGA